MQGASLSSCHLTFLGKAAKNGNILEHLHWRGRMSLSTCSLYQGAPCPQQLKLYPPFSADSRLDQDSLDTAQAAYVPLQPFDEGLIGPGVDLCNSGVYNVSGQAVKLPATITGEVQLQASPRSLCGP